MGPIRQNVLRGRILLDMVLSWIDVKRIDPSVSDTLNFKERNFFLKLRYYISGKDEVFYDVGAARGDVAAMAAKLNNVKSVYAFEPLREMYLGLRNRMNRYHKANCYNLALGSNNGTQNFYRCDATDSSSVLEMNDLHKGEYPYASKMTKISVEERRLDDVIAEKGLPNPTVIKIDVQGYEPQVIIGGEKAIRSAKYCILEMAAEPLYKNAPDFDTIYSTMGELGFRFAGIINYSAGQSGQVLQLDGVFEKIKDF